LREWRSIDNTQQQIFNRRIKYDIKSASSRLKAFYYKVSLPHFNKNDFLKLGIGCILIRPENENPKNDKKFKVKINADNFSEIFISTLKLSEVIPSINHLVLTKNHLI
jgi:hypothetical protein